ncbi:protein ALP1-like, partial [Temnothorax curvispinosus]|uniref:Protein ALP1-like n=1 Tax=Temnothorax curvispinosus TaxID=300111 RepID=A0A6J1R687_9HYME
YKYLKRRQRKADLHRFWVRPIFSVQKRYQQGDSDNLIKEIINTDPDKYFEYFRMNIDVFNKLLELIEPSITKLDVVRSPISATTRLQICLRYLASGDSMHSISFAFRVGLNTVSKIVSETCQAIWDNLKDIVFPENSENLWLQRAKEFEELLDFPNCIGAIDGKHVVLQAPPHGSTYYNYKNSHSIVLLAVADANCCFTIVDIGAEGRRSDGGIFRDSKLGHQLENNDLKLPKARSISENGPTLPYVLVGDAAFGLTSYMLRPYPQSCNLNIIKSIFNYRLSHTRKVVECTFGIWTGRWRIFRRPLITNVDNAILIVQSTVCLHNFLMMKDLNLPIENRSYSVNIPLQDQNLCQGLYSLESLKNNTFCGSTVRDQFTQYFSTSGAINQQWTKAYTRDY